MSEFTLPEGVTPEIAELFQKTEVQEVVKAIVQQTVEPLAAKKTELLDKYAQTKKMIDDLGGIDTIKTRLSAFEEAENAKRQAEQQAALASNDVEAVRKSLQDLIAQKDQELQSLKGERVTAKANSLISRAVTEAKGDLELLEPFITRRTKTVVNEAGEVVVQVFKEDGTPMLTSEGKDASVRDLMNEFKSHTKYAKFFEADNRSGSGTKTNASQGATTVDNPFMKGTPAFNVTKQMQLIKSQPDLARMLAQQAGVKIS